MKKHILLLTFLFLMTTVSAQIQYGYVKTKGRSVNGKYIHGEGLPGASVSIKKLTPIVVKSDDGGFDFPVPKDLKYHIYSVERNDYQLLDLSELRPRTYSGDTVFLVMVKPDQQKADLLAKERRMRRDLEIGLQKLEDSIQNLNISLEEKNRQLEDINHERELIEKYIKELAQYYATIDYDRIGDFQRQVDSLMENGEFKKARQLLYSKGSVEKQLDEIRSNEKAVAQVEEMTNRAKLGISSNKQELGRNCYSFFHSYILEQRYDSASYYIRFRANIDSTNAQWQYDAASFFQRQNNYVEAEMFYSRVLQLYGEINHENLMEYGFEKACTLHNLANLYSDISKSEALYLETINICNELLEEKDTRAYSLKLLALSNLASLYFRNHQDTQCEELLLGAVDIMQKAQDSLLIEQDPALPHAIFKFIETAYAVGVNLYKISNEELIEKFGSMDLDWDKVEEFFSLAREDISGFISMGLPVIGILGDMYYKTQQLSKCDYIFQKSLEICRKAADENPDAYNPVLIQSIQKLANFYYSLGRFSESEPLYEEALEISRKLAKDNPQAFVLGLVNNLMLLGNLYCTIGYNNNDLGSFDKSETLLEEALETLQTITEISTISYEENLVGVLNSLGNLYLNIADFNQDIEALKKSENVYTEAIEIERRLAKEDPLFHEPGLASTLNALGNVYYSKGLKLQDTQSYKKSEDLYKESIAIGRKLAENDPQTYNYGLAGSLIIYGNLQRDMGDFQQCEQTYKEALVLWRNLAKDNPELYEPGLAEALINVAQFKQLSMQYKEGIKLLEESHNILKRLINAGKTENQNLYLSNLLVLGDLYSLSENYEKAYLCYQESNSILKILIEDNETLKTEYAINLGNLSYSNLLLKRFNEAERYASEALTVDISQGWVFTNLAAALLLQGKYGEAEEIYRNMKDTLKEGMLEDLNLFERKNIIPKERKEDVKRIRVLLGE